MVQFPGFFIEVLTVAEPEKLGDDGLSQRFGIPGRAAIARGDGLAMLVLESTDSEADVAEAIGADRLVYQDLDDLVASVRVANPKLTQFDTSCFTGEYVTGDIDGQYLATLERERSDGAKAGRDSEEHSVPELHYVN